MLKVLFSGRPRWVDKVIAEGVPATAEILSDPAEILKGVAGYQGADKYLSVAVRVQATYDGVPEQNMKCRLSQASHGMLEPGTTVNVRYDPTDPTHIVPAHDVGTILSRRVKSPHSGY